MRIGFITNGIRTPRKSLRSEWLFKAGISSQSSATQTGRTEQERREGEIKVLFFCPYVYSVTDSIGKILEKAKVQTVFKPQQERSDRV